MNVSRGGAKPPSSTALTLSCPRVALNATALTADLLVALASKVLSSDDKRLFEAATGSPLRTLLRLCERLSPADVIRLSDGRAFHAHPLNAHGLHVLRVLLAERLTDRIRRLRGYERHPMHAQFRAEGILAIQLPDYQRPVRDWPPAAADRVLDLLRMVSADAYLHAGRNATWSSLFSTVRPMKQQPGDRQVYMHVDSYQPTWKAWIFPAGISVDHGPLMFSPGSHRPTLGMLRWLHDRTRRYTDIATVERLSRGLRLGRGAFADRTHGFDESLRWEGFDPRHPNSARTLGAMRTHGLQPLVPVETARQRGPLLVIAQTNGLHARGFAPDMTRRLTRLP